LGDAIHAYIYRLGWSLLHLLFKDFFCMFFDISTLQYLVSNIHNLKSLLKITAKSLLLL
jgi:hypothetical protein